MKILVAIFSLMLLFGCTNTIKKLQNKKPVDSPEIVKFEQVDLDKSGEISKQEFKTIKKSNNLVYTEPLWAFYGILALVAGLLIISNFLQRKKNNDV
jgi:hypothetical protein